MKIEVAWVQVVLVFLGDIAWQLLVAFLLLAFRKRLRSILDLVDERIRGGHGVSADFGPVKLKLEPLLQQAVAASTAHPTPTALTEALVGVGDRLPRLKGRRILWVDDQIRWDWPVVRFLQTAGFGVDIASSTDEALRRLGGSPINLVISDIGRVGSDDGLQTLAALRREGYRIPLIFYVTQLDSTTPPGDAIGITNDPVELVRMILSVLES